MFWVAGVCGVHIPLALLMKLTPLAATAHGLFVVATGFTLALRCVQPHKMATYVAYVAGSEVLWRMTRAGVPYEIGKVGVAAVLILWLVRRRRIGNSLAPVVYMLLLLPSVWLTVTALEWSKARGYLSFYLGGPFALMVCCLSFSNAVLTLENVRRVWIAFIAPVTGIAAIAGFATFGADRVVFGSGSNITTSGGFGPNQVSSALGLGMFFAMMIVLDPRVRRDVRGLLLALVAAFAIQSALTFSRGGLILAAVAVVVYAALMAQRSRARLAIIVVAALLFAVGNYALPKLDRFTEGKLVERFEDPTTSHRDDIVRAEFIIWKENPILGVGPGMATKGRAITFRASGAHTEYTRMLAEHGVLGLIAVLLLLSMAWGRFRASPSAEQRAIVAASLAWVFLYMAVNATRTVAPSFLFGMTFATLVVGAGGRNREASGQGD